MREIKFRAWDKVDRQMFYNVEQGFSFDDGSIYQFENFLGTGYQDADDYHEWTLMQFTGLKDKNGKEIYEGDVVENKTMRGKFTEYKESDGKYRYYTIQHIKRTRQVVTWDDWWGKWDITEQSERGKLRVLGNIHEGPELLKGEVYENTVFG